MIRQLTILIVVVCMVASCSKPSPFLDAERAAMHNDLTALESLVSKHPGLITEESGFDGHTLLFSALFNQPSYDCAKFLLDNGADPNHVDVTGKTPLSTLHKYSGDQRCEDLLLAYGAIPKKKNLKPSKP